MKKVINIENVHGGAPGSNNGNGGPWQNFAFLHPGCAPHLISNIIGFLNGSAPLNVALFYPPGLPNANQDCDISSIFPPGLS